ncbi:MAG: alpha/beta hydrolase [Dehalococcoidia bacterium]|jgi:pimeloyl-ACP methyl ester carboxylesterase
MKLVFIHGSGAVGAVWYFQKQHFVDADTLDLPGHPEGSLCTSVEEYVDWLHGYFQERAYKDVVLAGHSLGGGIVLMHALKYSRDLKGIISVASGARLRVLPSILDFLRNKLDDTQGWMNEMIIPLHSTVDENLQKILLPKLRDVGPAVQLNDFLCCDKFDIMDRLGEIKLPALAIVGDKDNMTPPKYTQYLAAHLPECRMSIIEDAGHLVFMEKPDQVNNTIEGFLKQIAT